MSVGVIKIGDRNHLRHDRDNTSIATEGRQLHRHEEGPVNVVATPARPRSTRLRSLPENLFVVYYETRKRKLKTRTHSRTRRPARVKNFFLFSKKKKKTLTKINALPEREASVRTRTRKTEISFFVGGQVRKRTPKRNGSTI
jgi:hypothetical protein